jgi:hypothetical protein
MIDKKDFPYCHLTECDQYTHCQDKNRILLRQMDSSERSIELHQSCQKITHWFLYERTRSDNQ